MSLGDQGAGDPDIVRVAKLVMDQPGADAKLKAAERADEMLERGDMDGAAIRRRILEAIEKLACAGNPTSP